MQTFDDIVIDPDFAALIPPLSPEEREQLETNIIEHGGARDPLVVWSRDGRLIVLDGHNRHEICTRLCLPFDVVEVVFTDREAAALWIEENQVGRRNLSDDQRSVIADSIRERRVARANDARKSAGAAYGRGNKKKVEDNVSSTFSDDGKTGRTRAAVAEELKVPERKLRAVAEVKKTAKGKELRPGSASLAAGFVSGTPTRPRRPRCKGRQSSTWASTATASRRRSPARGCVLMYGASEPAKWPQKNFPKANTGPLSRGIIRGNGLIIRS